jgi:hypothetical protein
MKVYQTYTYAQECQAGARTLLTDWRYRGGAARIVPIRA